MVRRVAPMARVPRDEVMAQARQYAERDTRFGPEHLELRAIDRDPSAG